MAEDIKKILEAGIKAPSGSNSQPWKFRLDGNRIFIFAEYKKDHPILNVRNRGTLIAHGGMMENILIACRQFGYIADVKMYPDQSKPELISVLTLEATTPKQEALFKNIDKRSTNRKPYLKKSLSSEIKGTLLREAEGFTGIELKLEEDPEKIKVLAEASSINEIVMLEDQTLHDLFYNEITWNEDEDSKRRMGFFLKTLEMSPPQELALRIFKNWPIINFFNKLGAARGIAASNAKVYAAVGAIGVILVNDNDEDFYNAGRLMERLWLTATHFGLGFHLVTGVLYLWQRIQDPEFKEISQVHRDLIEKAYQSIANIFNVGKDKRIAVLFRVGYSDPPSAVSKRIELEKLIEK